jgi:hypothetical protein
MVARINRFSCGAVHRFARSRTRGRRRAGKVVLVPLPTAATSGMSCLVAYYASVVLLSSIELGQIDHRIVARMSAIVAIG